MALDTGPVHAAQDEFVCEEDLGPSKAAETRDDLQIALMQLVMRSGATQRGK